MSVCVCLHVCIVWLECEKLFTNASVPTRNAIGTWAKWGIAQHPDHQSCWQSSLGFHRSFVIAVFLCLWKWSHLFQYVSIARKNHQVQRCPRVCYDSAAEHRLELTGSCSMDGHSTYGITQVRLQEKWRSQFLAASGSKMLLRCSNSPLVEEKVYKNPHFYLQHPPTKVSSASCVLLRPMLGGIGISASRESAKAPRHLPRQQGRSPALRSCRAVDRSTEVDHRPPQKSQL